MQGYTYIIKNNVIIKIKFSNVCFPDYIALLTVVINMVNFYKRLKKW